jgi:hypothetical protein
MCAALEVGAHHFGIPVRSADRAIDQPHHELSLDEDARITKNDGMHAGRDSGADELVEASYVAGDRKEVALSVIGRRAVSANRRWK